jgi:branched-chain amino acid transport system substrate-binding protein
MRRHAAGRCAGPLLCAAALTAAAPPAAAPARCADSGCAGVANGGSQPTAHASRAVFRILEDVPPGLFAAQNHSIAAGAGVAVRQLDAAGGIRGRWHVRLDRARLDGLSDAGIRRAVAARHAHAVILPCDSDSQLRMAAALASTPTVVIAPCNPDPRAGRRWSNYWPVSPGANAEAAGLANFVLRYNARRMFIVNATGSRSAAAMTTYFRRAAALQGIQITGTVNVSVHDRSFRRAAVAVAHARTRPIAVFSALPPTAMNRLARSMRGAHLSQPLVGTSSLDHAVFTSRSRAAIENTAFASYGFQRETTAGRRFAADYRRSAGRRPVGSFPGLGYESIRVLARAVSKARSIRPAAISAAFASGLSVPGVALPDRVYARGGDHNPVVQVSIAKVAAGRILPLVATYPRGVPRP